MNTKILLLTGVLISVSAGVLLTGCAAHSNTVIAAADTNHSASQAVAALPEAKTYGLVNNKAPTQIPAPSSYGSKKVEKVVNNMVAPSNQTYYFNENSVSLKQGDLAALKIQANYLITHPNVKIRLEGYADSRGSRENNILLAYKQLQSVENDLLQYGVAPVQIEVVSYGKEKPAEDGFGEPIWAINRRVQLVYEDQE